MNKDELRMAVESVNLEVQLKPVVENIDIILTKVKAYCECMEMIQKNKTEFESNMQMVQSSLLKLVNKLNDIAMHAMAINDRSIYYRCEDKKRQVRDTMEVVRNLYM